MVKENIEVKSVTIMIATPDEILSALTDPAQRQLWDPSITTMTKQSEDAIQIIYSSYDGQKLTENIKIACFYDKTSYNGTHFI